MRVTDRWTDGQNYDSQDHSSIAALRSKKHEQLLSTIQTEITSVVPCPSM